MKPSYLRSIDLNLLPILDALITERSVTKAGLKIFLTQSATSTALRRLRETFSDPILVRQGQAMVPSPKALQISKELRAALSGLNDVVGTLKKKDGQPEGRTVTISAPEHVHLTLSDAIRNIMLNEDPPLYVGVQTFNRKNIFQLLERGEADLALGIFDKLTPPFHRMPIYEEEMIVIVRKDHPIMASAAEGDRMSMSDFTAFPHMVVADTDNIEDASISRWLTRKAVVRKVGAIVGHISMAVDVLRNTDLICLGSVRSLQAIPNGESYLASLRLPEALGQDHYQVEMIWHDDTDNDPVLDMIRQTLIDFGKKL